MDNTLDRLPDRWATDITIEAFHDVPDTSDVSDALDASGNFDAPDISDIPISPDCSDFSDAPEFSKSINLVKLRLLVSIPSLRISSPYSSAANDGQIAACPSNLF